MVRARRLARASVRRTLRHFSTGSFATFLCRTSGRRDYAAAADRAVPAAFCSRCGSPTTSCCAGWITRRGRTWGSEREQLHVARARDRPRARVALHSRSLRRFALAHDLTSMTGLQGSHGWLALAGGGARPLSAAIAVGGDALARLRFFRAARRRWLRWARSRSTSIGFGLLHMGNPGATAQSVAVVVLAGVFLGAILVITRSLYAAWMAHFAWNWSMADVLHAAVSGVQFPYAGYRVGDSGPDWLTGGVVGTRGRRGRSRLGMAAGIARARRVASPHVRRRSERIGRRMSDKIAVVGSGQMGNGIAHVFAVAGFDVTMIDVSRERARRARARRSRRISGARSRRRSSTRARAMRRSRASRRTRVSRAPRTLRSSSRPRPSVRSSSSRSSRISIASRSRPRFSPRTPAPSRSPSSARAPSGRRR